MKVIGQTTLLCEYKGVYHPFKFHIAGVKGTTVIGSQICEKELKVIKRVNTVSDTKEKSQNQENVVKHEKVTNSPTSKTTCSVESQDDNVKSQWYDCRSGLTNVEFIQSTV